MVGVVVVWGEGLGARHVRCRGAGEVGVVFVGGVVVAGGGVWILEEGGAFCQRMQSGGGCGFVDGGSWADSSFEGAACSSIGVDILETLGTADVAESVAWTVGIAIRFRSKCQFRDAPR